MTTAQLLDENKDLIISNWIEKLKKELPIVNNHGKTAIENSVPDLLYAINNFLKSGDREEIDKHSRKHGFQRSQFHTYSLGHVIREYNYLKREILRVLDGKNELSPNDRNAILYVIDQAIEQSADVYHRTKQGVQIKARAIAEKKASDLELTDENREEFIQSVTHDLNNPLNNIKACISLLEGTLDVGEITEIMRILKSSTNQAEKIITEILDVGKISADEKVPLNKVSFNIIEELAKEIELLKVSYRSNIELKSKRDKILVKADIDLIRRSFNNILNNAIKHGNCDSAITVSCKVRDTFFELSVHNHGKVIPKEALDDIFNRYYKIDGTRKGWGIGLAFVKEIITAHNGKVGVESNEKKGTTFKFSIPVG